MADEQSLTALTDRAAVSDLILELARSLDGKDWTICRRCFLDEIETDYSDLRGEPPSRVRADDFVAKRRVALERLKTLHLSTNHQVTVDGDRACCVSAGVIYRLRPEDTHSLVRTPAGWKIARSSEPFAATPRSTQALNASGSRSATLCAWRAGPVGGVAVAQPATTPYAS